MAKVYGNRWEIVDSLASGGQAEVFRVRDLSDSSTGWVLKRLRNRSRLWRFQRELQALAQIVSPNIPAVIDYSVEDPAFIVTADLGSDLVRYAREHDLGLEQSLSLFRQIASAVMAASSSGVVHRDIKPNNVIVSEDGTSAWLIDFGLCQCLDGELVLLTTEEPFGNAAFAAPECFLGRELEPGPPADVYSLGKLLYWMVSKGGYINREDITDAVVARIDTDNLVIKRQIVSLIRKTVVAEPTRQCPDRC
jgi:serine/threonine protein kinase